MSRLPLSRLPLLTVALLSLAMPARSARGEDLATMMTYVSKDANALMIVNLKELLDSSVAQREKWRDKMSQGTLLGSMPLADFAETVVVSSKLLPGSLQNRWELVLISTTKPYNLAEIAQAEKSEVQTIGNTQVIFTARNSVIVGLSTTLMGVYSPAQRQDVARWLRSRENRGGKPEYSEVLGEAVAAVRDGAKLALSLDVDETLETNRVRQFLRSQPSLKDKQNDLEPIAKVFARMTGMHFRVSVALDVQGTFWTQFAVPVGDQGPMLAPLLMSALEGIGVNMDEFQKGKVQVLDRAVKVEASLTADGLKAIVSMMQPNTVAPPAVAKKADPAAPPRPVDPVAVAVERLYRQVVTIANEAQRSADRTNNMYRRSNYYEHAASRIEKLPLALDPAIQEFGPELVKGLRDIATLLRTAGTDIMVLENQIETNVTTTPTNPSMYMPNPWGFNLWNPGIVVPQYNIQTNLPQIVARQQSIIDNAKKQEAEQWKALQQRSMAVRKVLADKYGIKW